MKNAGKYLYIIPIAAFGIMHFANVEALTQMMPEWMPMKSILVYLTGIALIAAAVALIINKKAPLAMMLLGIELLSFAILINLTAVIGGNEMMMGQVLKDTAMAGAAFYLSANLKEEEG